MDTENHTKPNKIKPLSQFPNSTNTTSKTTTTTSIRSSSSKSSRKPLADCTNNLTPLSLSKSKPHLPSKTTTPPPPPLRNPNSVSGPKDVEVSEPCVVYGEMQTAEKRKGKGKDIAVSMTAFPATVMDTENHNKPTKIKPPSQFPNSTPTTSKSTKTTRRTSIISSSSKNSRKPLSDCTNNLSPLSRSKSKPPLPSKSTTPPPHRNPHSVSGPKDVEVSEPSTVYGEMQTAEKRKSKGKDIAVFMTAFPAKRNHMSRGTSIEKGDGAISMSCPVPNKKKQHSLPSKDHALQEYIRQQQSYFAEIDAFELPEEVVASVKDLD